MKRYDLSRIMTRAHYIFGHTFNTTFSYCLEVTQARKNTEALCKVLRKLRLKKSKEIA